MGCVASTIDKDKRVQTCREKKKLMKQLVGFREEFADALLAYLRALKNTGVTLRQFTESESLESLDLENIHYGLALPPSPPPPLPPSPPPPPPFSPDLRKFNENNQKEEFPRKESIEIEEDDNYISSLPSPIPSSWYHSWDPFLCSSPQHHHKKSEVLELGEDEKWAETKTEFEDEDQKGEAIVKFAVNPLPQKPQPVDLVDDSSSTMSGHTKDTADMPAVVLRGKKTLEGIMRELDDYFLKASAGGKEIAVLVDIKGGHTFLSQGFKENNRKNSAKVFSALSWTWSSKSLLVTKEAVDFCGSSEPCRPGAHCITLKKLYAAEQKLYKEVKEEKMTKLEYERKSILLQKQEDENHDWTKTEKTRLTVESLASEMIRLQQSISTICSSMLELIDEELYPQLVMLTSGLMQMWKTMYECHQVQNHISQQLNHLHDNPSTDFSTDYHRQATAQLETEVTYWYNTFSKLIKSQREYVLTLSRWIQLTGRLADDHQHQQSGYLSVVRSLCEVWQLSLDRLPDKVTSEAIKGLLSAIHSVLLQQAEEYNLQKKSDKLDKRLQKELCLLAEMEIKLEGSSHAANTLLDLSPKHPISVKRTKTEALKKQVDGEKDKYLNAVHFTRAMTLNNLKTSLPVVFQALMGFSSASAQAIEEAVHSHVKPGDSCDVASQNSTS